MNKKRIILAAMLILVLIAGFVGWQIHPVPATMRLDLTGTPGLKVAGTVVVDGISRDFSGVLPTNITVVARTFDYTVLMQEPRGELHGQLSVANGVYGSSSTTNDFTGVRGSYYHRWGAKGGGFTVARKGE